MRALIISGILLLISSSVFSQKKDSVVNRIRKDVNAIDSKKNWQLVVLNNDEFLTETPDGGGKLTGYFDGTKLRKMVRWIGISNGTQTMEFYYRGEELIFIYEESRVFKYDSIKQSLDYSKNEINFRGRYYFVGGKLAHHETTGHNRFEDPEVDVETFLITESKRLRVALINARKKK